MRAKIKPKRTLRTKFNKRYLIILTAEEHEYLCRAAYNYNTRISAIIRSRTFFRGWRKDLEEFRKMQNNLPISDMVGPGRRHGGEHELEMPVEGTQNGNGERPDATPRVPKGGRASSH